MSELAKQPEIPRLAKDFQEAVLLYNPDSKKSVEAHDSNVFRLEGARSALPIKHTDVSTSGSPDETWKNLTEQIDPSVPTLLIASIGDGTLNRVMDRLAFVAHGQYPLLALLMTEGGSIGNLHRSSHSRDKNYTDYLIENGEVQEFRPMSITTVDAWNKTETHVALTNASWGRGHYGTARLNEKSHRSGLSGKLRDATFAGAAILRHTVDGTAFAKGVYIDSWGKKLRVRFPEGNFDGTEVMYLNAPETAGFIKAKDVKLGEGFMRVTASSHADSARVLAQLRFGRYDSPERTTDSFMAEDLIQYQIDGEDRDESGHPYLVLPQTTVIIGQTPPINIVTNRPEQFPLDPAA